MNLRFGSYEGKFLYLAVVIVAMSFLILSCLVVGNYFDMKPTAPSIFSWQDMTSSTSQNKPFCKDDPSQYPKTWDEIVSAPPPIQSGVGIGALDGDFTGLAFSTYKVRSHHVLTGRLHLWYPNTNENNRALHMRFLVLLDEQQLSNAINDSLAAFYDLVVHPGDQLALKLTLPPLDIGVHDLNILAFHNIDDVPNDIGSVAYTHARYTLVADDWASGGKPRTFIRLEPEAYLASNSGLPLLLSLDSKIPKYWNGSEATLNVPLGHNLHFNIRVGYISQTDADTLRSTPRTDQPVAVILLFDYQQVEVAGRPAFYGILSSNTYYSRIESSLTAPLRGNHDILAIRINYPGIPICILQGYPGDPPFPFLADVQRASISVTP